MIPCGEAKVNRITGFFRAWGGVFAGACPSAPCVVSGAQGGECPRRHWLALPRGRGPSQTPPSRATDSSISPGPPSPWLPALLIGNRFLSFLRQPRVQSRGCKGRSPLHEITLVSPFPPGRGRGDGGKKVNQRQGRRATNKARPPLGTTAARSAGDQPGKPPPGTWFAPCTSAASGSNAGMQGAKPLA